MRNISSSAETDMQSTVTRPIILVELGFIAVLRYASSAASVSWNGQTWSGGRLTQGAIALRLRQSGGAELTVSVQNNDNAISTVILLEGASGKTVKAWYLYGSAPYAVDDAIQVFEGEMDGVSRMDDIVQLDAVSEGLVSWSPRITATPERFDHMQPAGTIVTWGNERFTLEPDSGAF